MLQGRRRAKSEEFQRSKQTASTLCSSSCEENAKRGLRRSDESEDTRWVGLSSEPLVKAEGGRMSGLRVVFSRDFLKLHILSSSSEAFGGISPFCSSKALRTASGESELCAVHAGDDGQGANLEGFTRREFST